MLTCAWRTRRRRWAGRVGRSVRHTGSPSYSGKSTMHSAASPSRRPLSRPAARSIHKLYNIYMPGHHQHDCVSECGVARRVTSDTALYGTVALPMTLGDLSTTPISTFCVAFRIFVVGEHKDFKFGGQVDRIKSQPASMTNRP